MKAAKRLTKFGIWFEGPKTPQLFDLCFNRDPDGFDHAVVGTGESRAVAASRALSHMRDLNVKPIMGDIESHVQRTLGPGCAEIEAAENELNMYCIIAISVER
ncbi:MAG: hypothetical protein ACYSWO_29360 [Planctomycetota bacterium]